MPDLTLVIGNCNTSSWSLRPWLALKAFGIPFREAQVNLRAPDAKAQILAHSPSGLVPALKDGPLTIWDSLAIIEYVAELFPEKGLWPGHRAARALARAISAEMHSGFRALRMALPMSFSATDLALPSDEGAAADIARVKEIWRGCLARPRAGAFLFGPFSAADAMYAPVVSRFRSYGVPVEGPVEAYVEAMWSHPAMREWLGRARGEAMRAPA